MFEGDAQQIVNMLKGSRSIKSSLDIVIKDTLSFIKRFSSYSFRFVIRDCNRVAHLVAKYVLHLTTWQGDYPDWVARKASLDYKLDCQLS